MFICPVPDAGNHTRKRDREQTLLERSPGFRREAFAFAATAMLCAVGLVAWLAGAEPARALGENVQVLVGGFQTGQKATKYGAFCRSPTCYHAPGVAVAFGADEPNIGKGRGAATIKISKAGVLGKLWMKVVTRYPPTDGSLTATVMINGVDTAISCQVLAQGQCRSGATVNVRPRDRLVVRFEDAFVDAGSSAVTYTLLFD